MSKQATKSSESKVLLVGWAGVDWQAVDSRLRAGEMPALQSMVSEGVRGRLAPVRPLVSPMLWTSAVTGKRADKHGICSFYDPLPNMTGLAPVSGLQRRSAAIWDYVSEARAESIVVGWPVVDPAEPIRGTIVKNDLGNQRSDHRSELSIAPEISLRCEELKRACGSQSSLEVALDAVLRLHANACELIRHEPWRFAAVCYPVLATLAATNQPATTDPRAAEKQRESAWRLQDALLAELKHAAGSDTNIVLISPHGPTNAEPSASESGAAERQLGLFCATGPHVRTAKTHYGATVLDVAPTVLRLLGLVEDEQTDGVPLLDCLKLDGVNSSSRPDTRRPRRTAAPFASKPRQSPQPTPDEIVPTDEAACLQVLENQRVNRALALSDSDRFEQAIDCWRDLLNERPDNETYAVRLVECLMRNRQYRESAWVIDRLAPKLASHPIFQLLLAEIAVAEERFDEAAALATAQIDALDASPHLLAKAASVLSECGDFAAAETCFSRSIGSEAGSLFAHAGLADLYWEQDTPERSLAEARKALAMAPALTKTRFTLAQSLHRIGQKAEAIVEFERCLEQRWRIEETHSYLASLYWADDPVRAAHHREMTSVI